MSMSHVSLAFASVMMVMGHGPCRTIQNGTVFRSFCRLLEPFTQTAHMGLGPTILSYQTKLRPNIRQINKTFPKLTVEWLAQMGFGDLGDLK